MTSLLGFCCGMLVAVSGCGGSETSSGNGGASGVGSGGSGSGGSLTVGSGGSAVDGSAGTGGSQVGTGGAADGGPGGAAGGSDPPDAADVEPRVDVADAAGKADGSDAAQTGVSYAGCMYIGQIDRMVIAKRDIPRNLCFTLVLTGPGPTTQGLTVPPGYGLDYASAGPSSPCPSLGFSPPRATQVTGIVEGRDGGTSQVKRVNVDVTMSFPANDAGIPPTEHLEAENVDVDRECVASQ